MTRHRCRAPTVEINFALALDNLSIDDVGSATIWEQGHTQAEPATCFVSWVTTGASS